MFNRKKVSKVKIKEVEPVPVVEEVLEVPVKKVKAKPPVEKLPKYGNLQVVRILERDVRGFHHCEMSNATTMHVPVSLF